MSFLVANIWQRFVHWWQSGKATREPGPEAVSGATNYYIDGSIIVSYVGEKPADAP